MLNKIITKILALSSFGMFVFTAFKSAACFYDGQYIRWALLLLSSFVSYVAYAEFINSLNEI